MDTGPGESGRVRYRLVRGTLTARYLYRRVELGEPFGGFDLAVSGYWLIERYNQLVAQSLMRAFSMVVLKILADGIPHRLFAEKNQSIEALRLQ